MTVFCVRRFVLEDFVYLEPKCKKISGLPFKFPLLIYIQLWVQ